MAEEVNKILEVKYRILRRSIVDMKNDRDELIFLTERIQSLTLEELNVIEELVCMSLFSD